MADESWRKLTPSQIEERIDKLFPKEPKKQTMPRQPQVDPLSKLPEDVRALRTTQVPTIEEREETAKEKMRSFELPVEDDVFEEETISVSEDEIDEVEEIGEEVEDLVDVGDLPSDEEVVKQMEEDRLAGLADDAVVEYAKDEDDEDGDEKEKGEEGEEGDDWDGDHTKLITFITDSYGRIPRHRGTMLGCQRAHCFLKYLLDVLSKGVRTDFKGKIDEDSAEKIRVKIMRDMAALDDRINYLNDKKFASDSSDIEKIALENCPNCDSVLWKNAEGENECLICNGKHIPGTDKGGVKKEAAAAKVQLVASPLVHGIASVIINAKVSGGKDVEKVFKKMAEKYDMNDREKFEVIHLLSQMGFPLYLDRGRVGEGNYDHTDGEGVDWLTNYYA